MALHTEVNSSFREVMEEKRVGMLNHLIGVHQHPQNRYYRACGHEQTNTERLYSGKTTLCICGFAIIQKDWCSIICCTYHHHDVFCSTMQPSLYGKCLLKQIPGLNNTDHPVQWFG